MDMAAYLMVGFGVYLAYCAYKGKAPWVLLSELLQGQS